MKITLVPSTVAGSGAEQFQYTTSAVINDIIAIDAGSLGFYQPPQYQARIRHVLITHTHIDHIASLPIFIENAFEGRPDPVTLYGSGEVLNSCQQDLFNDRVWPDFIGLSRNSQKPFLRTAQFDPGQTIELEGIRITSVAMNHVVPTVGFLLEDADAAIAFISDTGPTEEIWQRANQLTTLRGVFVEACFPNHLRWLADLSKHLTPDMLGEELRKLTRPARILAVHIKARYQDQVIGELQALGNPSIEVAQFGVPYTF